jgi:hypothetical protein
MRMPGMAQVVALSAVGSLSMRPPLRSSAAFCFYDCSMPASPVEGWRSAEDCVVQLGRFKMWDEALLGVQVLSGVIERSAEEARPS